MNINSVNTAPASVETIPLGPPMTVSAPHKTGATENTNNRMPKPRQQTEKSKEEQKSRFSAEEAKQLAAQMNEIMDDLQTSLGFSIREDLNNQVVVEITDRKTKELIKQIPTEEMLAIKEKMEEFSGLFFDQKV
ncbi:MAG: flagellar protein FlaG [Proteobacteria bacterium]|nr:flagellar protein FlaG [Desulfobacula sp.]MBU3951406.1 flagellar protein FlaG [Pseudomonadota bacterium]MBU4130455.1 flagellar protein FlaG [Pseudomonadota bacterium]